MMHAGARAFSGDWTWRRVTVTDQSPPRETYWWQGDQHLRVTVERFLIRHFHESVWIQSDNLWKLNKSISLSITENLKKKVRITTTRHFKASAKPYSRKIWEACIKKRVKQSLYRPWEFHEVEAPMKLLRLSALRTGCLYTPGNIPGTQFC